MKIITTLLKVGFKELDFLNNSDYFIPFEKDGIHLFVFNSTIQEGDYLCATASGETIMSWQDVIVFHHLTDTTTTKTEIERIEDFKEKKPLLLSKRDYRELKPIPYFNLYEIIVRTGDFKPHENKNLKRAYQKGNDSYFLLMDEEKIGVGRFNILGIVKCNEEKKLEQEYHFSELDRAVYFSNPALTTKNCVIFSSFFEMLAFNKLNNSPILMIVTKKSITRDQGITIETYLKSKYIDTMCFAFTDNLEGYYNDLKLLEALRLIEFKEKSSFYKIVFEANKKTNILFRKIKELKKKVDLSDLDVINKDLIKLAITENLEGNMYYVIELSKIANVLRAFFTIAMKYLIKDITITIIKPKAHKWSEELTLQTSEDYQEDIINLFKIG